jgi:uncharacterized protein (DUF1330 family)
MGEEKSAPAYAVARVRRANVGHPEVGEYLTKIQSTLDPFSGRFLVHGGGQLEEVEGTWGGVGLIVIEFPDRDTLKDWYQSEAYRAILPLRTRNTEMDVIVVDGVPPGYDPASLVKPP